MQTEMKYIYTVYEKRSFSKAAQALFLTQPALSIAVQKVEEEIGMPLFDRSQKPLGVTEAGRIYVEKIRQMQILEDELRLQLQDLSELNVGKIRIGGSSYFISYILPPVLTQYRAKYPGIKLDIIEAGAYELKEMLKEQKLDLTFISQPNHESLFKNFPAFQDRILLAVPASFPVNKMLKEFSMTSKEILHGHHLRFECPTINLASFSDTPFVLLEPHYNLRQRTDSFFDASGIRPLVSIEVAQIVTAYSLALAGIGATFIPDRIITDRPDALLYYKIVFPQVIRDMNIVTNKKSYISRAVQLFIEMFTGYYRS